MAWVKVEGTVFPLTLHDFGVILFGAWPFLLANQNLTYLQYFTISYIHKVSDVHFLITNPLGLGWADLFLGAKSRGLPEKPKERNEVDVDIPQTALKKQHVHKPD